MIQESKSSRIPNFYKLSAQKRLEQICNISDLNQEQKKALGNFGAIPQELAESFIENTIGSFSIPLGIATNFLINNEDILVPMAVEESSVVAAASFGAKIVREGGGFKTTSTNPIMTGQIQIFPQNIKEAIKILENNKEDLLAKANKDKPRLVARGGGAREITLRHIPEINSIIMHIDVDTRDAMGANTIDTVCEGLANEIKKLIPCEIGLRILTNLATKRLAKATCEIPPSALDGRGYKGTDVVDRVVKAYQFAFYDIYRATTHNKGVMNGIDPVLIATGNDWRAAEAAAHAYACLSGSYKPITKWQKLTNGNLQGEIELPMAVGTVGGVTKLHPTAKAALSVMNSPNSRKLGEIACAVGLAQNLSALRALACEGIQKGHMSLHEKNLNLLKNQEVN